MTSTIAPPPASPGPPVGPAAVVARARQVIGELEAELWAARSPGELLATNLELDRLRSATAAVAVSVAIEIDAVDAQKTDGWASAGDYLTETAGAWRGHGSRLLRTGRALTGELTATHQALAAGRVSPEHAVVIAATIGKLPIEATVRAAAEAVLLEEAARLNATELKTAAKHLLELLDPDGTAKRDEQALDKQERSAHLGRFLTLVEDGLGGVRLKGRGTVEDAAILKAALAALAAPDPTPDTDSKGDPDCDGAGRDRRDSRDHGARAWDALVETCQQALDAEVLPESHGAKPRVSVTVTLDQLKTGLGTATLVETGEVLSVAAVRKLACDADLIPGVLGSRGEILDVGRAHRLVTTALWLTLVLRDRHCAFPGCRRPPIACDAHHIRHWVDGGKTKLDNLVLLCRAHHTVIHTTPWQVRLNPDDRRPEFQPPPGRYPGGPAWIRHRPPRE